MYLPPTEIASEACLKKVIVNSVPSRAESRSAGYSGVFARPQPKMESSDIRMNTVGLCVFIIVRSRNLRSACGWTAVRQKGVSSVGVSWNKDTNLLRNGKIDFAYAKKNLSLRQHSSDARPNRSWKPRRGAPKVRSRVSAGRHTGRKSDKGKFFTASAQYIAAGCVYMNKLTKHTV